SRWPAARAMDASARRATTRRRRRRRAATSTRAAIGAVLPRRCRRAARRYLETAAAARASSCDLRPARGERASEHQEEPLEQLPAQDAEREHLKVRCEEGDAKGGCCTAACEDHRQTVAAMQPNNDPAHAQVEDEKTRLEHDEVARWVRIAPVARKTNPDTVPEEAGTRQYVLQRNRRRCTQNDQADANQTRPHRDELVRADVLPRADGDRGENLKPIPRGGSSAAILLAEIAEQDVVILCRDEPLEESTREPWRLVDRHGPSHPSCGRSFQSLTSDCLAERTARRPLPVILKYFFARPPRSAVGSPSSE